MNAAWPLILLPSFAAAVCLAFRRRPAFCAACAVAALGAEGALAALLFARGAAPWGWNGVPLLAADGLSRLVCLGIACFGLLAGVYSLGWFAPRERGGAYWCLLLLTEAAGMGVALADHLVLLLCAWGFMGITLYLLIAAAGPAAADAAKKTMLMVGGTDAFMVLGVALLSFHAGAGVRPASPLPLSGAAAWTAYLCIAAAAFAKAGAVPFHTWIPDCAERAPVPVTALLPASLDKLLGIYLVARASLTLFAMNAGMQRLLLAVGAATIICGVMMAMAQHDLKRLLGYHAVSQVGYMLIGIGTGNAVGIAGGLFHMLNHSIYKTCLFFSAGSVERRAGTADLDGLGGLSRAMPVTFAATLIASLSISGVPPLNGFASKWMVYQGLLEMGRHGGKLWTIWLLAAMFGSVLTLASFVKVVQAVFLSPPSSPSARKRGAVREAGASMAGPAAALAAACVALGVWAVPLGVAPLIRPAVGAAVSFPGFWNSTAATVLLAAGLLLGLLVCLAGRLSRARECAPFIGGEEGTPEMILSGTDFYQTITEMRGLRGIYRAASRRGFDLYDRGRDAVFAAARLLQRAHGGCLPVYIAWCLAGLAAVVWALAR